MKRLLWLLLLVLPAWASPEAKIEAALFEGGEGLGYFQRCARELGGVEAYGDPRISEKLRIRLLEGTPPEVSNANLPYDQLIRQGKLLPLDHWLDGPNDEGSGRWRDDFLPGSLERYRIQGRTYGIPLTYVVQAVYYDRRLFRQHGWTPPADWESWLELCRRVQARGLAPLAFQGRYSYYASPLIQHLYFHLAGRRAYRDQLQLQPGSFDNPAMVRSLTMVSELARDYFQPGSLGMSHTEAQLEFLRGRAAMLVCGSWLKSEMRDKIPAGFELAEFPIPLPDHGAVAEPDAIQTGAGYFFVFAESRRPEKGVAYLRYLTRRSQVRRLVQEQDLPVAVAGANQALSPDLAGLTAMLQRASSSFGESMTASEPGMVQVWSDVRFELLRGSSSPAQLARRLELAAEQIRRQRSRPDQVEARYSGRALALLGAVLALLLWGKRPSFPRSGPESRLHGRDLWLLVGPPLAIYWLFFLGPTLVALLASGCSWDGLGSPSWIGSLNFRRLLLASPRFWQALANNLFLMACIPTMVTLWSLLCAVLLQADRGRHRLLRALYFFPHLLGIGGILIWQQLYHPQGPLNLALCRLGLEGFRDYTWLSQDHLYPSLLPLALWGAGGFQLILTSAALSQVPQDLQDAARLDGADRWQQLWLVSWPFVRPTVVAGYFLLLISAIKSFETVWLLTNQEPASQVHVLGTLLMQTAFAELQLGEATAVAAILLVLVLALQRPLRRWEEDDECAG